MSSSSSSFTTRAQITVPQGRQWLLCALLLLSSIICTSQASSIDQLPAAPTNLSVTTVGWSTPQLVLAWTSNSSDAIGFSIENKIGYTGTWAVMTTVPASMTSITQGMGTIPADMYYRVRAWNAVGYSTYSNESAFDTSIYLPPAAPINLTATAISTSQIDLSWQPGSGYITGFKVECQLYGSSSWSVIATLSAQNGTYATQYDHTGLAEGTPYRYRVNSFNSRGFSPYSSEVLATTMALLPPVLSNLETTVLNYTEGKKAKMLTANVTVSDVDSTELTQATIQIGTNYQLGQDLLSFVNVGGITGSWNEASGTLTLSGNATLANYQAALRAVTIQNTSDQPVNGSRTVTFMVRDGSRWSLGASRAVQIKPIKDGLVLRRMEATTLKYTVGDAATPVSTSLDVAWERSDRLDVLTQATVKISANYQADQDVLSFTNTCGITGSWNALTGTLTLSGSDSVANYRKALRTVTYSNDSDVPSSAVRTVSFQVWSAAGLSSNLAIRQVTAIPIVLPSAVN